MDRLKALYEDSGSREEIVQAVNVLRKYDIPSALLWRRIPKTKGYEEGDSESLALASAFLQGFRDALTAMEYPFADFQKNNTNKE